MLVIVPEQAVGDGSDPQVAAAVAEQDIGNEDGTPDAGFRLRFRQADRGHKAGVGVELQ